MWWIRERWVWITGRVKPSVQLPVLVILVCMCRSRGDTMIKSLVSQHSGK